MGLGQYDGLGEYCGPHTASSVFLLLISVWVQTIVGPEAVVRGNMCQKGSSSPNGVNIQEMSILYIEIQQRKLKFE